MTTYVPSKNCLIDDSAIARKQNACIKISCDIRDIEVPNKRVADSLPVTTVALSAYDNVEFLSFVAHFKPSFGIS